MLLSDTTGDDSGQFNTIANNRTTADTSVLAGAPPLADAGLGSVLGYGQTGTLDGSGTRFMVGSGTVDFLWEQIYGTPVSITDETFALASFVAPALTELELFGFRLTASGVGGSTYDEVYFAVEAVPEPTCGVLLVLGMALAGVSKRRRRP